MSPRGCAGPSGELLLLVVAGVDVAHQLCTAVIAEVTLSKGVKAPSPATLGLATPALPASCGTPRRSSPGSQT